MSNHNIVSKNSLFPFLNNVYTSETLFLFDRQKIEVVI